MGNGDQVRVDRPLLEGRLATLPLGGVAVIAGSAGYGKSSAVAAWCSRSGEPTRWLRASTRLDDALAVTADEDDGVRLPRLGRALRRQRGIDAAIAALIGDLGSANAGITLVVDDADRLSSERDGLATLRAIVDRPPDRSRVVLIGRRVAALRLATARSRRAVIEIGAASLRLSPLQARQIAEARGWNADAPAIEAMRRFAAGNGGVFATHAALHRSTDDAMRNDERLREADDFVRGEVVGGNAGVLRRLAMREQGAMLELLRSLWSEGLILAPACDDEFGGDGWSLPESIATALGLPSECFDAIDEAPTVRRHPARSPRFKERSHGSGQPQRVRVRDLGPIEISVGESTIDGTRIRPRSLALLLFLATRPRHSATREEVIEALWPDAEPEAGVNSLNQAIYHLRRALDPLYDDRAPGEAAAYVRHEAEIVSMHPELVAFDSARLMRTLDTIRRRPSAEELDAILDLSRGGFAADLPFEEWATEHRDAISVGLTTAVERAMIAAQECGDLDRAIDIVGRAVRIDPSNADLAESLALLLEEGGAHAASRRAAVRASAMLREVGVEPPAELLRLSRPATDVRRHAPQ